MQRFVLQPVDHTPFAATAACRRVVAELMTSGRVSDQTFAAFERVAEAVSPAEYEAIAAAFSRAHPHLPALRVRAAGAAPPVI
jgi:hypothetical protein